MFGNLLMYHVKYFFLGIDVSGIKPLVSRTEIQIGRTSPSVRPINTGKPTYKSQVLNHHLKDNFLI